MPRIDVENLVEQANKQQRTLAVWLGLLGLAIWLFIIALGWGVGWFFAKLLSEDDGIARPWWPWIGSAIGLLMFVPSLIRFLMKPDESIQSPEEFGAGDSILRRHDNVAGAVGFAMLELAPKLTAEAIRAVLLRVNLTEQELRRAEQITDELYALNDWVKPSRYPQDAPLMNKLIAAEILWAKETPRGLRVRLSPSHMD